MQCVSPELSPSELEHLDELSMDFVITTDLSVCKNYMTVGLYGPSCI